MIPFVSRHIPTDAQIATVAAAAEGEPGMTFALQDEDGHTYATVQADALADGFRAVYRQYCRRLVGFAWFDQARFDASPRERGFIGWNSHHERYPGPAPFGLYTVEYVLPGEDAGNTFIVAVRPRGL